MTTTVRATSAFESPLYGDKPRRRIPGTTAVAVTMSRSDDNSVREYAIFTADGMGWLGRAYWTPKRKAWSAGYTMASSPTHRDEKFANLAEFATVMAERLELDVTA